MNILAEFCYVTLASDDENANKAHKVSKLNLARTKAHEWRNNKRVIMKKNDNDKEKVRRVFVRKLTFKKCR